jgi:hypothetical protein
MTDKGPQHFLVGFTGGLVIGLLIGWLYLNSPDKAKASVEHPPVGCHTITCERRVRIRQQRVTYHCIYHRDCVIAVHRRQWRAIVEPYREWMEKTAQCESGGNWSTNTGNGFYGGIQFTIESWNAVGGDGLPSDASKLEQMYRGVRLMRIQGKGAWPVCGQH